MHADTRTAMFEEGGRDGRGAVKSQGMPGDTGSWAEACDGFSSAPDVTSPPSTLTSDSGLQSCGEINVLFEGTQIAVSCVAAQGSEASSSSARYLHFTVEETGQPAGAAVPRRHVCTPSSQSQSLLGCCWACFCDLGQNSQPRL